MKVRVVSGQHKGRTGDMRGDLAQRKATLGKDGKVLVALEFTNKGALNDMPFIRIKHLEEAKDLFS